MWSPPTVESHHSISVHQFVLEFSDSFGLPSIDMRVDDKPQTLCSYLVQWAGSKVAYSLFLLRELTAKLWTKLQRLKQLIITKATVALNEFNILLGWGIVLERVQVSVIDSGITIYLLCLVLGALNTIAKCHWIQVFWKISVKFRI